MPDREREETQTRRWGLLRPSFKQAHLRVHPATRAMIAEDLLPFLDELQTIAEGGERVWSLSHLERLPDDTLLCAIWWDDADGETHRLHLSAAPDAILEEFRVYCAGLEP